MREEAQRGGYMHGIARWEVGVIEFARRARKFATRGEGAFSSSRKDTLTETFHLIIKHI